LEELLELLRNAEQDSEIQIGEGNILSGGSVDRIIHLADQWLITVQGACHWSHIQMIRDGGFRVYAGEKDSFGWLTGCIDVVGLGTIVYG